MATPSATARVTPTGLKLREGYQSLITFSRATSVNLWEKTVQPPGVDGGEPVDQTTMHNVFWRTKVPRELVDLTPATMVCAYDPAVYTTIINTLVNQEGTITVRFSDGTTVAFYGYLQKFIPNEMREGEQPEATVTIVPTNIDPNPTLDTDVEFPPLVTAISGT